MQKMREKLNANAVGASIARPHFIGMTLKKQKGITLIALIITFIVMLILVGVTINVALNGGLFEKADDAAKQTQKEVEKEQLLNAVLGTLDNNGKFNLGSIILPLGFDPISSDEEKVIYKAPSGQYYEVSKITGKIEETETPNDEIETNEIIGIYGSTVLDENDDGYIGFEFKENGIGYFYYVGEKNDLTYNENSLAFVMGEESYNLNYNFYDYKDETTTEILNKSIVVPDLSTAVTTNSSLGFSVLDGKIFKDIDVNSTDTISFENEYCRFSNSDGKPYVVFNGIIYAGDKAYPNIYWKTDYRVNNEFNRITQQNDKDETIVDNTYDLVVED